MVESIPLVLTGIGIIVSILYYAMVLRSQTNTRQAQLFMQIYNEFKNKEFQADYFFALNAEWADYSEYLEKYMGENFHKGLRIASFISVCEGLGVLVYRKLIDISMVDDLMRGYIIRYWDKYSTIADERRQVSPLFAEWTEYLYNELQKIESKPGYLRQT